MKTLAWAMIAREWILTGAINAPDWDDGDGLDDWADGDALASAGWGVDEDYGGGEDRL